jgi:multimeric flavodoxin WrbA
MNEYLEKTYGADAVILGSPTYFTDVSAEMKALLDRAGMVALANGGALKGKESCSGPSIMERRGSRVIFPWSTRPIGYS